MSTLIDSTTSRTKPWAWAVIALMSALVLGAIAIPNLNRSRMAADQASAVARERVAEPVVSSDVRRFQFAAAASAPPKMASAESTNGVVAGATKPDMEQKMIRTSSIDMLVQHPAQVMESITALAERSGGYLVNSQGGGQDATSGSLTIRVPAARFNEARAEIRKLGLRVESDRVDAQDVTRQYVDEDANLRNLRAEESQYLAIMKQANTVKDLLAVSEKLSEVRGQIEQQQAEFNSLSKQIETVAITISLKTEVEAQVFGLNWRPLYEARLALRDGLDGVATYATAMMSILFYLPAVVLWLGTLLSAIVLGWKTVLWVGRIIGWSVNGPAKDAPTLG